MMKSEIQLSADYNLFIKIQMDKYFKIAAKTEFSSEAEAKLILDRIVSAYNEKIASDHLRLDNLNDHAKQKWFESIEIDFLKEEIDDVELPDDFEFPDEALDEVSNQFDQIFYFLPEGAWRILLFAGPAFEAYGLPLKRFKKIFKGELLTEIEIDLFTWAYDLTLSVFNSISTKSKKKKIKFMEEAVETGMEFLSEDEIGKVIHEINDIILHILDDDFLNN